MTLERALELVEDLALYGTFSESARDQDEEREALRTVLAACKTTSPA